MYRQKSHFFHPTMYSTWFYNADSDTEEASKVKGYEKSIGLREPSAQAK